MLDEKQVASSKEAVVQDPVCGMEVEREEAAGSSQYEGSTYYFCSAHCQERFDEDPEAFLGNRVEEEVGGAPVAEEKEGGERIELPISGMSCASCAQTIEKELRATAGVLRASVNFATERATVGYDPRETEARADSRGVQEVEVAVKGGYTPDVIVVEKGRPVRLAFHREETAACSDTVVFGDFGISRRLPAFRTTAVEFTPQESGEFTFTCGMGMLRGKLIVEET